VSDLEAFLTARLDEDEAAAKAAPGSRWRAFADEDVAGASVFDEHWRLLEPTRYDNDPFSGKPPAAAAQYIERGRDELVTHIARHDPARVLREVEAKRKILGAYVYASRHDRPGTSDYKDGVSDGEVEALAMAAHALAAVWSDHPDYDPGWGQ
jgi:hypothetical protein